MKIWFFEITVKLVKLLAKLATERKTTGTNYHMRNKSDITIDPTDTKLKDDVV